MKAVHFKAARMENVNLAEYISSFESLFYLLSFVVLYQVVSLLRYKSYSWLVDITAGDVISGLRGQKVHIKVCPFLDGHWVMAAWNLEWS